MIQELEHLPIINPSRIDELKNLSQTAGSQLLNKLITSFINSVNPIYEILNSEQIYKMSIDEKESLFHKLAGLSANMGADKLSKFSKKLQTECSNISADLFKQSIDGLLNTIINTKKELNILVK